MNFPTTEANDVPQHNSLHHSEGENMHDVRGSEENSTQHSGFPAGPTADVCLTSNDDFEIDHVVCTKYVLPRDSRARNKDFTYRPVWSAPLGLFKVSRRGGSCGTLSHTGFRAAFSTDISAGFSQVKIRNISTQNTLP